MIDIPEISPLDNYSSSAAPSTWRRLSLHQAIREGHHVESLKKLQALPDINAVYYGAEAPIHDVARWGTVQQLTTILARGGDLHLKNSAGESPLLLAFKHCNYPIFQTLLQKNAQPGSCDQFGDSELHIAVQNMWFDEVQLLIQRKADVNHQNSSGNTPLHRAALRGDLFIVRLLLDAGANPNVRNQNGVTPIETALTRNYLGIADTLITHGANLTDARLITLIIARGLPDLLRLALKSGISVNSKLEGDSLLTLAIKNRQENLVHILLANFADIHQCDPAGNTPLHLASFIAVPTVRSLLNAGANPNHANEKGHTPLHMAAIDNRSDLIREFIMSGAAINARDLDGNTPLHLACKFDRTDVVYELLCAGAPKTAENSRGKIPQQLAGPNARLMLEAYEPYPALTFKLRQWFRLENKALSQTVAQLKHCHKTDQPIARALQLVDYFRGNLSKQLAKPDSADHRLWELQRYALTETDPQFQSWIISLIRTYRDNGYAHKPRTEKTAPSKNRRP